MFFRTLPYDSRLFPGYAISLLTYNLEAYSCMKLYSYLSILAKVTLKQCPGAILIIDSKMQSASCVSVICEPNNFRVASFCSGNLRVVSFNWTSLWVVSYELIIRLWVGSSIFLHYIKSSLSICIIFKGSLFDCTYWNKLWKSLH